MSKTTIFAAITGAVVGVASTLVGVTIKNVVKNISEKKMKTIDEEEMMFLISKTRTFLKTNKIENVEGYINTIESVYDTFVNDYRKFFITTYDYIDQNDVIGLINYFEHIRHILSAYSEAKTRNTFEFDVILDNDNNTYSEFEDCGVAIEDDTDTQ